MGEHVCCSATHLIGRLVVGAWAWHLAPQVFNLLLLAGSVSLFVLLLCGVSHAWQPDRHTACSQPCCGVCMYWCAVQSQAGLPSAPFRTREALGKRCISTHFSPGLSLLSNGCTGGTSRFSNGQSGDCPCCWQPLPSVLPASLGKPEPAHEPVPFPNQFRVSKGSSHPPSTSFHWPNPHCRSRLRRQQAVYLYPLQPHITCPQRPHNSTYTHHTAAWPTPGGFCSARVVSLTCHLRG